LVAVLTCSTLKLESAANKTTHGGPDYNTATHANADRSIAFQTGGSAIDNRVGFTRFERQSHAGVCKNEAPAATQWQYRAFLQ
jgi:hypothetical protein